MVSPKLNNLETSPIRELPTLTPASAFSRQFGAYAVIGTAVAGLAIAVEGGLPPLGFFFSWRDLGLGLAGVGVYAVYNGLLSAALRPSRRGRASEWKAHG